MALADYYARNALAAAQVLAGFNEDRIREVLDRERVCLHIGADVGQCREGRALVDLLVRLIARLYPTLVVRAEKTAEDVAQEGIDLARRINPAIDFSVEPTVEVAVGAGLSCRAGYPRIFAGSHDWNAFVGTREPLSVGDTPNPFGAGAAACLAAANLFRWVFLRKNSCFDEQVVFSVLAAEPRLTEDSPLRGSLGDMVLVGAGAIGNATAWALSRIPMAGAVRIVDHETIDLGNLQRYVLAEHADDGGVKAEILARYFNSYVQAKPHTDRFENFVATEGHRWERMMLALDSAGHRRAAQASLPQWVANAWTQPGDLGVSTHDFLNGACVSCLYLPDRPLENADEIIASTLGVPNSLMEIRTLLHSGEGVPRHLLEAISEARKIPMELLLPFEGDPLQKLYAEGFCGGVVLPLGALGQPRQEVHVPLSHQSALSGVLLAASVVRQTLGLNGSGTRVTRIDVMRPLASTLTQPAAKDPRGICICQDPDYRQVYRHKYGV